MVIWAKPQQIVFKDPGKCTEMFKNNLLGIYEEFCVFLNISINVIEPYDL